jgi:hypothetical protein
MTIYINRPEAECLLDALTGGLTASQHKMRDELVNQLLDRLGKKESKNKDGWTPGIVNGRVAPLRSSWPQNITRPSRKQNPYHHKPRAKKDKQPKPAKPTLSPQEIL